MNKAELINAIAEKANLTKVQAKNALDATICAVSDAMAKNDKVSLIGFGTFAVVEKGERTGRDVSFIASFGQILFRTGKFHFQQRSRNSRPDKQLRIGKKDHENLCSRLHFLYADSFHQDR